MVGGKRLTGWAGLGWAGSIQFPNPVPDLYLCGLDSGDRFWQVTTRQAIRSPYGPVRGSAFTDCHRKRVRPLGSSAPPQNARCKLDACIISHIQHGQAQLRMRQSLRSSERIELAHQPT